MRCQPRIISIYIFMRHATRNHGGNASNFERRKSHSRNDATLRYSAAGGFHPIVLNLFCRLFVSAAYISFLISCKRFCLVVIKWIFYHNFTLAQKALTQRVKFNNKEIRFLRSMRILYNIVCTICSNYLYRYVPLYLSIFFQEKSIIFRCKNLNIRHVIKTCTERIILLKYLKI